MTTPETPAGLLRRAADRLDALDQAALDDWHADGRKVCVSHGEARRLVIGSFGFEEDAETAAALRPLAPLLAAMLRASATRWDENNILDRPESGEMQPRHPEAWWCGSCQGAIESPDYPGDDQRCMCGWWDESLTLARAVLAGQGDDRG